MLPIVASCLAAVSTCTPTAPKKPSSLGLPSASTLVGQAVTGSTARPVGPQYRNALWSYSTVDDEPRSPSDTWSSRVGCAGSDTSNRLTWAPVTRPSSSASWPMPSSRPSPTGCR
jgi:hypothetical protein